MKRSAMLLIIEQAMNICEDRTPSVIANVILEAVEKAGMTPPKHTVWEGCACCKEEVTYEEWED